MQGRRYIVQLKSPSRACARSDAPSRYAINSERCISVRVSAPTKGKDCAIIAIYLSPSDLLHRRSIPSLVCFVWRILPASCQKSSVRAPVSPRVYLVSRFTVALEFRSCSLPDPVLNSKIFFSKERRAVIPVKFSRFGETRCSSRGKYRTY